MSQYEDPMDCLKRGYSIALFLAVIAIGFLARYFLFHPDGAIHFRQREQQFWRNTKAIWLTLPSVAVLWLGQGRKAAGAFLDAASGHLSHLFRSGHAIAKARRFAVPRS